MPVGIGGSERAQPRGRKLIRPVRVRVVVGDPLLPPARAEGAPAARATSRKAVRDIDQLQVELQKLFDQAEAAAGG